MGRATRVFIVACVFLFYVAVFMFAACLLVVVVFRGWPPADSQQELVIPQPMQYPQFVNITAVYVRIRFDGEVLTSNRDFMYHGPYNLSRSWPLPYLKPAPAEGTRCGWSVGINALPKIVNSSSACAALERQTR